MNSFSGAEGQFDAAKWLDVPSDRFDKIERGLLASGSTAFLKDSLGSEQYQAMNSSIACRNLAGILWKAGC